MKRKFTNTCVLFLSGLLLFGCASASNEPIQQPNQDANPAGIVLEGADQEKNITVDEVASIELYDIEDKLIEKEVNIEAAVDAFNASMIDDTFYIQMITGYKMVITLVDGNTINLTSYGSEDRVVASGKDFSYHLISPELGKILLDK